MSLGSVAAGLVFRSNRLIVHDDRWTHFDPHPPSSGHVPPVKFEAKFSSEPAGTLELGEVVSHPKGAAHSGLVVGFFER
jgi:hypothetical protein